LGVLELGNIGGFTVVENSLPGKRGEIAAKKRELFSPSEKHDYLRLYGTLVFARVTFSSDS